MIPYGYQVELASQALGLLRKHAIAYLACEERTGKTLAAIMAAEQSLAQRVLVITKKKAISGWTDTLAAYEHEKLFYVINYEQAKNCIFKADLVILDEAHNFISSFPKKSTTWHDIARLTKDLPILYISATPHAQGYQQLYHQFALSSWSPWSNFKSAYAWFKVHGIPYQIKINGEPTNMYNRTKDSAIDEVRHLFITKTRTDLGFEQEPEDKLHTINLDKATKDLYNKLLKDKIVYGLADEPLVCDTPPKLRVSLHMLEGGVTKIGNEYVVLSNTEKLDYILATWGDSPDLVIMYNYIAELTKLSAVFKQAKLLQATSYAEGVDLHQYKHLVIYSQDFSTARHTQRRARQANKNRKEAIIVHFLLVKGGISERVYKTVSINKKNFVDTVFEVIK